MQPSDGQGLQIDSEQATSTPSGSGWASEPAATQPPEQPATMPLGSGLPGMPTATADPAPAPGMPEHHFRPGQPVTGPDAGKATFKTDEEYFAENVQENHTLPAVVLVGGVLASIAMAALGAEGGLNVVLAATIGVIVQVGFGTLINTFVGWIVGKMFNADFGSAPVMLLRFGAVTSGYIAAMGVLALVMGPMFALLLALPVLLVLSMWLACMEMFQAMVYSMILTATYFLLTMFLLSGLMALAM